MNNLEAKVAAVNAANACAALIWPKLAAALAPFVGQKVVKADGSLIAKVEAKLPELPNAGNLSVTFNSGVRYSLVWRVQANVQTSGGVSMYDECSMHVGALDGEAEFDRLREIGSIAPGRSDWTADEVIRKRAAWLAARRALTEAELALSPFNSEFDR